VVTGYLPGMILNGFIYLVPSAMLGMASFEGCVASSQREIRACNMVFYFLLGNVFFLSVLSGSLLDQIGESFTHPKNIPNRLASAVSAQVTKVHVHRVLAFLKQRFTLSAFLPFVVCSRISSSRTS
jgi:calcium permeable stress-gated cation channel